VPVADVDAHVVARRDRPVHVTPAAVDVDRVAAVDDRCSVS
jgi:hypothetical protein